MAQTSCLSQLRALLWRTYLMKWRGRKDTALEITMPLLFFAMVLFFIGSAGNAVEQHPSRRPSTLPAETLAMHLQDADCVVLWAPSGVQQTSPRGTTTATAVMTELEKHVPPTRLVQCTNAQDLEQQYLDREQHVCAGIIFDDVVHVHDPLPDPVRTILRVNGSTVPNTATRHEAPQDKDKDGDEDAPLLSYYESGFLAVQQAVANAIQDATGGPTAHLDFQPFPTPAYTTQNSIAQGLTKNLAGLYMVIGFFPVSQKLLMALVREKEHKTKIGMTLMGMSQTVFYLAWHIIYTGVTLIPCTAIAALANSTQLFGDTSPVAIFGLLLVYTQSLIALAFLISTFFDKMKTAGSIGKMSTFFMFLPSYALSDSSPKALTLLCMTLSSPIGFRETLQAVTDAENQGVPIGSTHGWGGGHSRVTYVQGMTTMLLATMWYFAAAIMIDALAFGKYGTMARPCRRRRRRRRRATQSGHVPLQPAPSDESVEVIHLTKQYNATGCCAKDTPSVLAVNDVSLSLVPGEVFCLLGHNGAGKSTLISCLSGLYAPTSGQIRVFGEEGDVAMDVLHETMGICPQHDILFEALTAKEHLELYGALKGVPRDELEHQVRTKLMEVDLEAAADTRAAVLSGGQKRKLSVAIALIGPNVRVVILDEPTSGCDVASSRHIWRLIKEQKKDKIVLLTSHDMTESDVLGDRIAVLSHGKIQVIGTSLMLKSQFGTGYVLHCVCQEACDTDALTALIQQHVAGAHVKSIRPALHEAQYALPREAIASFEGLLAVLEEQGQTFGVDSYGLSFSSLEDVFLRLAMEEEHADNGALPEQEEKLPSLATEEQEVAINMPLLPSPVERAGPTLWTQVAAVMHKRFLRARRNKRALFYQFVLPSVYIIAALLIYSNNQTSDPRGGQVISPPSLALTDWQTYGSFRVPVAASSPALLAKAMTLFGCGASNVYRATAVPGGQAGLEQYLLQHGNVSLAGAVSVTRWDSVLSATVLVGTESMHAAPYMVSRVFELLACTNQTTASRTWDAPFSYIEAEPFQFDTSGVVMVIFITIAMSMIPITFAVDRVKERKEGAVRQQFVQGLRVSSFWVGNYAFDILGYSIPISVVFVGFAAFGRDELLGPRALAALCLLLLVASGSVLLVYVVSRFFTNETEVPGVLGLLFSFWPLVGFFILVSMSNTTAQTATSLVFALLPLGALPVGLFDLVQGAWHETACRAQADGCEPMGTWGYFAFDHVGKLLLVLVLDHMLLVALLALQHSSMGRRWCGAREVTAEAFSATVSSQVHAEETLGVRAARAKVSSLMAAASHVDYPLVVSGLSKGFASDTSSSVDPSCKVVVDDVNFCVRRGETLGLLGPNGAGKTTTLRMLAGELAPTRGDAVYFDSIHASHATSADWESVYARYGVCPQEGGLMDTLTTREHLDYFLRIRGVEAMRRRATVDRFLGLCMVREHADKLSSALSGGNKRRLQLGIALISDPEFVLLDELSCGVDPQARRGMWDLINATCAGRSSIMTTHSLDEAEALCSRIAILVNGRLRALGTSQELKHESGDGYEVVIESEEKDVDRVWAFMRELVGDGLEPVEAFGGRLRFVLPRGMTISRVFGALQGAREELGIVDYAVSQSTLEQVFLRLAAEQSVEGEEGKEKE